MKMVHEKLCSIISELDAICEELRSLIKEVEFATSPISVDDYFKFLLALKASREAIGILEGIIKETENVTSTT